MTYVAAVATKFKLICPGLMSGSIITYKFIYILIFNFFSVILGQEFRPAALTTQCEV